MDISTLKEYVRLNNRRLSPSVTDCSEPDVYNGFASTVSEIKELNYQAKRFYSETMKGGQERFRFGDISLISFLLMSSPMLLATPGIGEQIFGNQGGCAIGYFLTLAILIVRIFLQGFVSHFRVATVGHFLRIALLVICGYLHLFKQATFFGTTGIWVFVYIMLGSLVTLFIRSFDIKRIKAHQAEFTKFLEKIDKLDFLSEKCAPMYSKLADKAEVALESFIKTNNLHIVPTKRTVWFRFKHDPDRQPWGNKASVDFSAPFEEKRDFHKTEFDNSDEFYYKDSYGNYSKSEDGKRILKKEGIIAEHRDIWENTYINSQEFGWTYLTEQETTKLISDDKILPYYGMEVPQFLPELKYRFFRHYYDLTIETIEYLTQTKSVKCHSKAQDEFLSDASSIESEHHYYEATRSNDPHVQQMVAKYEAKKQEIYDSLHGYEEQTIDYPPTTTTKTKKAEEIGGLLIFTPDDELIGVYAGDTEQSLEFISNEIRKYTEFVPDVYSQPFGYTQTQVMRRNYFS